MPDDITLEGFLGSLGIEPETETTETPETETTSPETETETTETETETVETETEETTQKETETPEQNTPPDNRQAQAFAQMRIDLKKKDDILKGIAEVVGLKDAKNPDEILSGLQNVITQAQAKAQGIPPELMQRLQQLEARDKEFTQTQIAQQAYTGFQKVKDTYKLDNKALNAFADELIAAGQNPFQQPMDLVNAYKLMHHDEIVQREVEKAIKAEAERAAKAAQHSSTPGSKAGGTPGAPEKITNISELNAFFEDASKK